MSVSKEELAIEIAQIDGVKVNNVDFTEAGEDEILQKLAADTASSDHKDSRLRLIRKRWSM